MFEVVEISLATTDRFFDLKIKYPELKGFGLKAFDRAWILDVRPWAQGERVVEVGGAYSWLPARLRDQFGCEMWVADDFGMSVGDSFWLRQRSPQDFVSE